MERLVLIDGHAILHRAYHALPPLKTSKGELVNAVFGFCSMLLKVIHDLKPTHLVVCFDRPELTFRQKIYKDYQAQRPKMEEKLVSQVDLVKKVVKTMEIPIYEMAGYEADDVIGSLVSQAAEVANLKGVEVVQEKTLRSPRLAGLPASSSDDKNFLGSPPPVLETIIVTGDKDILQLVNENTKVYMLVKGLSLARLYGEKEVEEKYGIIPEQIVDYKALIGDPSDNYPGVKGVGPKTASNLLKKFGSLEKIYDKKNHVRFFVNKRVVRALISDKDQAIMAKKLAKIVSDVPVKFELEKCKIRELDKPKVKKLFKELEFKSLISRLSGERFNKKEVSKMDKKSAKKESAQLSLLQ